MIQFIDYIKILPFHTEKRKYHYGDITMAPLSLRVDKTFNIDSTWKSKILMVNWYRNIKLNKFETSNFNLQIKFKIKFHKF